MTESKHMKNILGDPDHVPEEKQVKEPERNHERVNYALHGTEDNHHHHKSRIMLILAGALIIIPVVWLAVFFYNRHAKNQEQELYNPQPNQQPQSQSR